MYTMTHSGLINRGSGFSSGLFWPLSAGGWGLLGAGSGGSITTCVGGITRLVFLVVSALLFPADCWSLGTCGPPNRFAQGAKARTARIAVGFASFRITRQP